MSLESYPKTHSAVVFGRTPLFPRQFASSTLTVARHELPDLFAVANEDLQELWPTYISRGMGRHQIAALVPSERPSRVYTGTAIKTSKGPMILTSDRIAQPRQRLFTLPGYPVLPQRGNIYMATHKTNKNSRLKPLQIAIARSPQGKAVDPKAGVAVLAPSRKIIESGEIILPTPIFTPPIAPASRFPNVGRKGIKILRIGHDGAEIADKVTPGSSPDSLALSAPIDPRDLGSPLIHNGKIIGIVNSPNSGDNPFARVETIQALLQRHGLN